MLIMFNYIKKGLYHSFMDTKL